MPRCHGSYIGPVPAPTASVASGVWKLRDAQENLAAGNWPSQPAVPGAPNCVIGYERVSLSWTALTTSPSVTDYGIQYSDDDGETWTTYTDSISNATTATVTGLTNGTAYVFRLYGVNPLGNGPYGSVSAPATPADTTALLLRFDGSFDDEGPDELTVTANGDAEISDVESKYGGESALFSGTGYLDTDPSVFDFGSGDFTVETWVYLNADQFNGICGSGNYSGAAVLHIASSGVVGISLANVAVALASPADAVALEEWTHVVWQRSNGTGKIFVNGVEVASGAIGTFSAAGEAVIGCIGANEANSAYMSGYLDDFRVSHSALYDGNFTPPGAL